MAKAITTIALFASAVVLIALFRQMRDMRSGYHASGTVSGALADSTGAFSFPAIRGPFTVNGMDIEFMTDTNNQQSMSVLMQEMVREGWAPVDTDEISLNMDPAMLRAYQLVQRDGDMRVLMEMKWLGGIAVCTVTAGTEFVMPFYDDGRADVRDVPGDDFPGIGRPASSRRVLHVGFSDGGFAVYALKKKATTSDANNAMRSLVDRLDKEGWSADISFQQLGLNVLYRGKECCKIWSPPPVDGSFYVAVLMTGAEREEI